MNLVVLVESICGYICVIPIILLYFVFLKHTNKKQQGMRIIVSFMFCYYLIGILTICIRSLTVSLQSVRTFRGNTA